MSNQAPLAPIACVAKPFRKSFWSRMARRMPPFQSKDVVPAPLTTEPVSSAPRPPASPSRCNVPVEPPATAIQVSAAAPAIPPLSMVSVPVPAEPISMRSLALRVEALAVVLDTLTVPTPPAWSPI